jgi:hypothetical protein
MRRFILAATAAAFFTLAGCSGSSSNEQPATASNSNGTTESASSGGSNNAKSGAATATKGRTAAGAAAVVPTVIPAGTVVTVRLGETLGSKTSSAGQGFSATLAEALMVDGKEVAPRGASASGTVVDAVPLGKFKGGAKLDLKLTSVTLNNQQVAVNTSIVDRQVKGKGKRSAVMIGGGAGLGALIGGLAGGGKGAAIGAGAGAAAGTGGTYFTGNKEIVLPAETAISFKLKDAVELK